MAVTEIQVIQYTRTRITHLYEIVGQTFQLGQFRRLPPRMGVLPSYPVLQSLLDTEIGIVQTLIHAAGFVERFYLGLQDVAGKTEPLRHGLVQRLDPFDSFGQLILQSHGQHSAVVHARSPPVMPHGVQGMDTGRLQHPVAQRRFHTETE